MQWPPAVPPLQLFAGPSQGWLLCSPLEALLRLPEWREVAASPLCSAQEGCFQHIHFQAPILKIFLVRFLEKVPPHPPKCVGVYKVKILGLKISHLGAEEHRKDDNLLLELSLSKLEEGWLVGKLNTE